MDDNFTYLKELIITIENNWDIFNINLYGLWINKGWTEPTSNYEICYFIEGSNTILINDIEHNAKKHDIFFNNSAVNSTCVDSKFKMYYITFSVDDCSIQSKVMKCFNYLSESCQAKNIPEIQNEFATICSEMSLAKDYSMLTIKHSLINILINVYRHIKSANQMVAGSKLNTKYDNLVKEIVSYINDNFNRNIDLKALSIKYFINEKHLNRIFKTVLGYTIHHYILKIRIENSKRILEITDSTITDVAFEVGYYDCAHFSKTFKRWEGITPFEYRKKIKML